MSIFKKLTSFALSLCLSAAAFGSLAVTASAAETRSESYGEYSYEDGYYHISNADQLVALTEESENEGSPVLTSKFILDKDITIPTTYENKVNIAPDTPFSGVFDGNGHTISGLRGTLSDSKDNGLFGSTDGAVIKNLILEDADLVSVSRSGFIVGVAENTKFYNVSVRNSTVQVMSGGVGIELITADGVTFGGIAGEVYNNSLMYDCETVDTYIYSSEVEVISAANGDGYYVGGLVGTLDNSHIEYCRTLSESSTGSGKININFVVAIDAVSVKNVYVGGIVGEMKNGASVIDSFSNIMLLADAGLAVAVGAATYGYLGGIAAITYGNKCKLERCHYSGTAFQRDVQGFVFVAIYQNKHRGGIIGCINEYNDSTDVGGTFNNLIYNYDRVSEATTDTIGSEGGLHCTDCSLAYEYLYDGKYSEIPATDIPTCASYTQAQYADKNNWESHDFDFNGSTLRDTPCNVFFEDNGNGGKHANQWVMHTYNYTNTEDTQYATTTMPIHGKTTAVINSNINNAFIEEPVSMEYQYTVSADNTVMLPYENTVSIINPNLANDGFIGIAFVSEREFEGQNVYTCDMLYQGGTEVSADIFETYASDPDKRIYAVWCQAKTLGAQLGLNEENKGFRVLTAVNTDLLDNIGLDLPDDEYGRGATFVKDGNEYFIQADSKEWRGESYYTEQVAGVDNARVFSIFAALQPEEYAAEISYAGDILWNGNNADGTAAVLDFICNMEQTSATELANMYLSDLANAGEIPESVLTEEQFGILVQYIG